jgi:hypothetical protein
LKRRAKRPTVPVLLIVFIALGLTADRTAAAPPSAVYPLDEVERIIPARGRVQCPKVDLELYGGTTIPFKRRTKIYVGFKPHLQAFERVVHDVALEVYGRAPKRLVHLGTFNCRRIKNYPEFLSEHGLGNAIDVAGFDFGALPRGAKLAEGAPRWARGGFKVRLEDHWNAKGRYAIHSKFLRTLARRLIARPEIFRSLLGPAWPGHHNHFHFDMAPWRTVEVFEAGTADPSSWYAAIRCADWSVHGPYETMEKCFDDHSPRREECHYLHCYQGKEGDPENPPQARLLGRHQPGAVPVGVGLRVPEDHAALAIEAR